jgi:hypothetical protein
MTTRRSLSRRRSSVMERATSRVFRDGQRVLVESR